MKKLIYSLFIITAVGFSATAQESTADMTFEKDVHDYGTIAQGADGNYDFKFTNTGKTPLIITDAKGSCGCTVPTWPKEPIKPGETKSIKVTYDTKRIGAFTKTVSITSNAANPTKILTIKGVVEATDQATEQAAPVKKIEKGSTPMIESITPVKAK